MIPNRCDVTNPGDAPQRESKDALRMARGESRRIQDNK